MKTNERFVYQNLLDERKKIEPKFHVNNRVRVGALRKTFSKSETTSRTYKLNKTSEVINDTLPSYGIDNLPEKYNEASLKKTE